ncbi:TonB-dependent receptor [Chamaesiphon minutus]|nr:TonB-dependent receptor [Chamaesiphon minutus]
MQKMMNFPTVFRQYLPWQQILITGSVFAHFLLKTTGSSATTASEIERSDKISLASRSSSPQLIAGADNFNPDLKLSPLREQIPIPSLPPPTQSAPSPGANSGSVEDIGVKPAPVGVPFVVLEGLQPNIRNDWNNSGQVNRTIESTAIFRLNNGDSLRDSKAERLLFTTGYNTYEQPGTNTVTNIPIGVDWETKIDSLKVHSGVGVDISSGSTTPNFNLKVDYPLTTGLTVSADLQQGAYKFNAKTIENKISALRYGPSIFWQIDKDTSLFSSLKLGNYSDNNQETQSFSRIERKFGEFSIAGNLFTWNYQNSTDKGYFAPPDFLVYTGEFAWEGSVIRDVLNCRISASVGGQNVNATSSDAGGYQTKCTAKLSPNFEADLGYSFSNVKTNVPINSNANSQSVIGQIRVKF